MYVLVREKRTYDKQDDLKRCYFSIVSMGTFHNCMEELKEIISEYSEFENIEVEKTKFTTDIIRTLKHSVSIQEFSIRNSKNDKMELKF